MFYNAVITVLLIASFLLCLKAFAVGMEWGRKIEKGITPKIEINPLKPIASVINDTEKEIKKQDEAIKNIFSYDADVALNAIKKTRG
jgi:hypothetical protein